MYTCGPTVYDYAHIGNMRSFVTADILKRYLEYSGFKVYQVKNITDAGHMVADADEGEDKMLKAAKKEHKSPWEVAEFYEEAFKQDEKKINIKPANLYPKVTSHIDEMIRMIEKLIQRGYAYVSNGSVYFEVSKFSRYGRLSGNTLEKLKAGSRIACHPDKKDPHDFALWIKAPKNHLLKWKAPWSLGYPGWHIECSAISKKYIGDTIDIHTGGEDNIFPHHEGEIAQSECATDKKFVIFWVHTRYLLVDGKKMAKSDGNFYTIRDLEKKGYNPLALRYLYLTSHYRDPINFTLNSLESAQDALGNLNDFLFTLNKGKFETKDKDTEIKKAIRKTDVSFKKYMDDDLNTPKAMASVFGLMKTANKRIKNKSFTKNDQKDIKKALRKYDSVLGFILDAGEEVKVDEDIKMLITEREKARADKDWAHSDAIRDQIEEEGYELKDTPWGVHVKKKV